MFKNIKREYNYYSRSQEMLAQYTFQGDAQNQKSHNDKKNYLYEMVSIPVLGLVLRRN